MDWMNAFIQQKELVLGSLIAFILASAFKKGYEIQSETKSTI
jgi:hypothetical protein